jgi:hypothetical protein
MIQVTKILTWLHSILNTEKSKLRSLILLGLVEQTVLFSFPNIMDYDTQKSGRVFSGKIFSVDGRRAPGTSIFYFLGCDFHQRMKIFGWSSIELKNKNNQ